VSRVARDLDHAADELALLASIGRDVEQYGIGDPETIARVRTRAAITLAAAAESMADARMLLAPTTGRIGVLTLAGLRSPAQLESDAEWCRTLAAVVAAATTVEAVGA